MHTPIITKQCIEINTLRAGTVMGLSNGFGAIAGIIVPLGKPSIVQSNCQLQPPRDKIENCSLNNQSQPSQFCFQNLKSLLILGKKVKWFPWLISTLN